MVELKELLKNNKGCDIKKNYPILRAVFHITPEMTFVKNTEFVYIAVSEHFAKSVGKNSSAEIVGKTDFELFKEELAKKHRMEDEWILKSGENMQNILEQFHETDGNIRYDSISKYYLSDEKGKPLGIYGVQCDVTQDILAKQQYEQEIQYLLEQGENVYSTHLIDVNEWKIIQENKTILGKDDLEIGDDIEKFAGNVLESIYIPESEAYSFYKNFSAVNINAIYQGGKRDIVLEYRRSWADGNVSWVQEKIKFIKNPENGHLLLAFIISDINERKQKEQDLIRQAETDALTGVLNRGAFIKKAEKILKTEGKDAMHALFFLDIDNFKKLNDTRGHQVGDEFLMELANVVQSCFRNSDLVGRLGGDEFLVLMRRTPGMEITTKNANQLLRRIREVCDKYECEGLSGSIGISTYPHNGKTLGELYEKADNALYEAKRKGKNQFEYASIIEENGEQ